MSLNSKSMTKITDNTSDGSGFNQEMSITGISASNYYYPKKKNLYMNMHHAALAT